MYRIEWLIDGRWQTWLRGDGHVSHASYESEADVMAVLPGLALRKRGRSLMSLLNGARAVRAVAPDGEVLDVLHDPTQPARLDDWRVA